ncbi:MAG TPA: mannose-1-phosphate guanylyltransferase [Bacillota bacterium]|nr:mannose-1-phosphate guanylyltransferase [Bacillota bacterium]
MRGNDSMIYPVIMAGGTGTRFWPKSRSRYPKQFLDLQGNESLLQATYRRLLTIAGEERVFVVTNRRYSGLVSSQLVNLPDANIIIEPMRRDTASCIGLTAVHLSRLDPDGVMVIVPSDHQVGCEEAFSAALLEAASLAKHFDYIITLGITPDEPKTGYGYICKGEPWQDSSAFKVLRFTEKPDLITAMGYLNAGNYLWNSGIFVCRVSVMLEAMAAHMPKLFRSLNRIAKAFGTPTQDEEIRRCYRDMEKISIDFGLMEKAENILVLPCECKWDDVGSWSVVGKMLPRDKHENAIKGTSVSIDTTNCVLIGSEHKLIATLGVENLIIVLTRDVVLVCQKDRDQEVKELVKLVKSPELRKFW